MVSFFSSHMRKLHPRICGDQEQRGQDEGCHEVLHRSWRHGLSFPGIHIDLTFPRHMGGGGVITFLGLDLGRKNHQGRNFHFLSTFWGSYSTPPARLCTAFAPLSLYFSELWRHSCCMLKLGPMVDMSVPTSGLNPRFSLLRQQTSNSWSVHWNMLHIGIYWMKHKGN